MLGGVGLVSSVRCLLHAIFLSFWSRVPATVVESHVDRLNHSGCSGYWQAVSFEYALGAERYRSRWSTLRRFLSRRHPAPGHLEKYSKGAEVFAYVNPFNHEEAVLEPKRKRTALFGAVVSAALLSVGLAVALFQ